MILDHLRDLFTPDWTMGLIGVEYGKLAYGPKGWTPNIATVGTVLPFGYIAEDCDRGMADTDPIAELEAEKKAKITAIPVSEKGYIVRTTWSNRFERKMPLLCDVPAYRGIRIHVVKNASWTEGCVGPALARDVAKGTTSGGDAAVAWVTARIAECEARGEEVRWRIRRDPASWAAFRARS